MFFNEFIDRLGKDNIDNKYLFYGREEYLMDKAVEKIKEKYITNSIGAMNFDKINGKEIELKDLVNICETLPFMSEKRIVVIDNIGSFISNLGNKQDKLYDYLDTLADFLILVFLDRDEEIKKNMKIYKYFNKTKNVVDFSKLEGRYLDKFIEDLVKKNNKKISQGNIAYFTQKSSYNSRNIDISLFELENELLKVINFSKGEITRDDIDEVLVDNQDINIFDLLTQIVNLNTDKALDLLDEMYMKNEPIQRIHYMITRQTRMMLSYKVYEKKGYSPSMIQSKMKVGNFEFRKFKNESMRFTIQKLSYIMKELLEMDKKLKTSLIDDKLAMEMFIVKISNRK